MAPRSIFGIGIFFHGITILQHFLLNLVNFYPLVLRIVFFSVHRFCGCQKRAKTKNDKNNPELDYLWIWIYQILLRLIDCFIKSFFLFSLWWSGVKLYGVVWSEIKSSVAVVKSSVAVSSVGGVVMWSGMWTEVESRAAQTSVA